ncbi:MAG: cytidine deaminase [Verrucomicrobiales bacterium]
MEALPIETTRGRWRTIGSLSDQPDGVPSEWFDDLMDRARSSRQKAYAPYSRFQVGAAVRMGQAVFAGANVENASYGATMCAERAAVFNGVWSGARQLDLVALSTTAETGSDLEARSPCGLCRQVIAEFAGEETLVLLDAGSSDEREFTGEVVLFKNLLPWPFRLGK